LDFVTHHDFLLFYGGFATSFFLSIVELPVFELMFSL
jgi:hypothetical protein